MDTTNPFLPAVIRCAAEALEKSAQVMVVINTDQEDPIFELTLQANENRRAAEALRSILEDV